MTARKSIRCQLVAALALLPALWAGGCRHARQAVGVEELAARLRAAGVAYAVEETAALPHVHARGLRLRGKDLEVELYRFSDRKELKLVRRAARMARDTAAASGQPMAVTVRGPFLVIVRKEPTAGLVTAALARALPE